MRKAALRLPAPTTEVQTVNEPRRKPNAAYRTREHLTADEVERVIAAAKHNRWGHRDATMLLVAYKHGLRAAELTGLQWSQVDFNNANLHVQRVKRGTPSTHPIDGDVLRALRKLQREQEPRSAFVFVSERGTPFTPAGFARTVSRAGEAAGFSFKVHAHMLRVMPVGLRWPIRAPILAPCRRIWVTKTYSTQSATPSFPPTVSGDCGDEPTAPPTPVGGRGGPYGSIASIRSSPCRMFLGTLPY